MNLNSSKLYLIAIFTGIFAGVMCIPFRWVVTSIASVRPYIFRSNNTLISHLSVLLSIFLLLLFVAFLVKFFPKIGGSGLPQTQALLYGKVVYKNPIKYLFVKFLGGIIALGSGLSLGREGTSVQMGSLTGYLAGKIFKVRPGRRRHLIAAGAGAGVAAAFTAPLSSSILILESLQKFTLPQTIICTLLAGLSAGVMSKLLLPFNIYDAIKLSIPSNPEWEMILIFILTAIYFSILGMFFSKFLLKSKDIYNKWSIRLDEKSVAIENKKKWSLMNLFFIRNRTLFIQAFYLSSMTWIIGLLYPTIIGGDQTFMIHQANDEQTLNLLYLGAAIFVISLFTIVSNSSGFPGGIFLPMMTVGGLSGKFFYDLIMIVATLFNYENIFGGINMSGYFILIGMSAFFIAVVRTPITGFILIAEMTGRYEVFFSTLVVGILVYYFTQLLKVKPMNDLLYDFMIKNSYDEPLNTTIYLEVESGSYFCDKSINKISLPEGCHIVSVIRNGEQLYDANDIFIPEDQIGIELKTSDIEKLYQSLVSLSV